MISILKKSAMLRWALAWLLASFLLTGVLQAVIYFFDANSSLGETALAQLAFILIFSLPWFLGGEILSTIVRRWKGSSWLQKLGSVVLLLPVAALMLVSLIFVGIVDFYFS